MRGMEPAAPRIVAPPGFADRQLMVGWFDPGPLIATGFSVLVSTLFGRHSDYRLLEAITATGMELSGGRHLVDEATAVPNSGGAPGGSVRKPGGELARRKLQSRESKRAYRWEDIGR